MGYRSRNAPGGPPKWGPGRTSKPTEESNTRKRTAGWTRNFIGEWRLVTFDPLDIDGYDLGPAYMINCPDGIRGNINLCSYTEEELLALQTLFETAFKLALPVVRERDRIAHERGDEDNDGFRRLYRASPELVMRPNALKLYEFKGSQPVEEPQDLDDAIEVDMVPLDDEADPGWPPQDS